MPNLFSQFFVTVLMWTLLFCSFYSLLFAIQSFFFFFKQMGYANPAQTANGIHLRQYSRAFIFLDMTGKRFVFVSTDSCMLSQGIKLEVDILIQFLHCMIWLQLWYTKRSISFRTLDCYWEVVVIRREYCQLEWNHHLSSSLWFISRVLLYCRNDPLDSKGHNAPCLMFVLLEYSLQPKYLT